MTKTYEKMYDSFEKMTNEEKISFLSRQIISLKDELSDVVQRLSTLEADRHNQ